MELAFGQFAGLGPLAIWSCLPIAKGDNILLSTLLTYRFNYLFVLTTLTKYYSIDKIGG